MFNEQDVNDEVDDILKKMSEQLESELSIVVGGKVSTGKSSFLNALFSYHKNDVKKFIVGAEAGVTTVPTPKPINRNVTVWDTPGLNDVNPKNRKTTHDFLKKGHDLSILIVSGAADSSQKENYELLRKHTANKNVIVVLNKVDEFSRADRALVIAQWKKQLGIPENDSIYPCVTRGYGENDTIIDPITDEEIEIPLDEAGIPKTIRGVDEVRKHVRKKLEEINKDLLFLQAQKSKGNAALMAISSSCISAGTAAFFPGAGVTVTATQVAGICSLNYIYTGEALSKSQVIQMLPAYAMQSVGRNLFLWAKSVLPPTGVVDIAAAGIAVTLTASMLLTVNYMLKNGFDLTDKDITSDAHAGFSSQLGDIIKGASKGDFASATFWNNTIKRFI